MLMQGLTTNTAEYTTTNPKTVGTSGGIVEGDSMSIAFNIMTIYQFLTQKLMRHTMHRITKSLVQL